MLDNPLTFSLKLEMQYKLTVINSSRSNSQPDNDDVSSRADLTLFIYLFLLVKQSFFMFENVSIFSPLYVIKSVRESTIILFS